MITRRCTQRLFLLRPDDDTNQIFLYVLGLAAQRTGVQVILPSVQANHHHEICHDPHGRLAEFTQYQHGLTARAMNCLRGRFENFWASEQTSVVRLVGVEDLVDKLVYAATNPVKDGLVAKVHHWPGVNGLRALLEHRAIVVKRPRHFFREDGDLPEEVELTLGIPPELGDVEQILEAVRVGVAKVEAEMAALRAKRSTPSRCSSGDRSRGGDHEPGTGCARRRGARAAACASDPTISLVGFPGRT